MNDSASASASAAPVDTSTADVPGTSASRRSISAASAASGTVPSEATRTSPPAPFGAHCCTCSSVAYSGNADFMSGWPARSNRPTTVTGAGSPPPVGCTSNVAPTGRSASARIATSPGVAGSRPSASGCQRRPSSVASVVVVVICWARPSTRTRT